LKPSRTSKTLTPCSSKDKEMCRKQLDSKMITISILRKDPFHVVCFICRNPEQKKVNLEKSLEMFLQVYKEVED